VTVKDPGFAASGVDRSDVQQAIGPGVRGQAIRDDRTTLFFADGGRPQCPLANFARELCTIARGGNGRKRFQQLLKKTRVRCDLASLQGRLYLPSIKFFERDGASELRAYSSPSRGPENQVSVA
jgi:hypothetical protein